MEHSEFPDYANYPIDDDRGYTEPEPEPTRGEKILNYGLTVFFCSFLAVVFSIATWLIFNSISSLFLAIVASIIPAMFSLLFILPPIGIIGYGAISGVRLLFGKQSK